MELTTLAPSHVANQLAQESRSARSQLRRLLFTLPYWEGRDKVAELIEGKIPNPLRSMVVYELLVLIRHVSPDRAVRFLVHADVPNVSLSKLTYGERERLIGVLRGFAMPDEEEE